MPNHKRHVIKDLKGIKVELDCALSEIEILNTASATIHIKKATLIVDASLERERFSKRG